MIDRELARMRKIQQEARKQARPSDGRPCYTLQDAEQPKRITRLGIREITHAIIDDDISFLRR